MSLGFEKSCERRVSYINPTAVICADPGQPGMADSSTELLGGPGAVALRSEGSPRCLLGLQVLFILMECERGLK